jgi:hypothetical protein
MLIRRGQMDYSFPMNRRVNTRVVTTRRATIGTALLDAKSLVSMQKTLNAVGKAKSITIISMTVILEAMPIDSCLSSGAI